MRLIPLLLILIAVLEIMVFMWSGQYLGFWLTVVLVLASAFVGAFLIRAQGVHVLVEMRSKGPGRGSVARIKPLAQSIFESLCLMLTAAFLITPGFLTDITGLLLLVPSVRLALYAKVRPHISSSMMDDAFADDPYAGPWDMPSDSKSEKKPRRNKKARKTILVEAEDEQGKAK